MHAEAAKSPQAQAKRYPTPLPPYLFQCQPFSKHILCNVEFSQICPVKPRALSDSLCMPRCVWRPRSVYRCISMTCFCLMSSFFKHPLLAASLCNCQSVLSKARQHPTVTVKAGRYSLYTPKPAFLCSSPLCSFSCLAAGIKMKFLCRIANALLFVYILLAACAFWKWKKWKQTRLGYNS